MEAGSLLLETTTSVLVPSQLNPVNVFTIYLSFFYLRQSLSMVSQVSQIKPLSFHRCTVHCGFYILFTHQQMNSILNLEKFRFT
jgi:hypothetical protein